MDESAGTVFLQCFCFPRTLVHLCGSPSSDLWTLTTSVTAHEIGSEYESLLSDHEESPSLDTTLTGKPGVSWAICSFNFAPICSSSSSKPSNSPLPPPPPLTSTSAPPQKKKSGSLERELSRNGSMASSESVKSACVLCVICE